MDDNDIIIYFCGKKKKNIQRKKLNNIPEEYKEYLENRYNDFVSYRETIIRIMKYIEEVPKCPICGKNNKLHNYKCIYLNTCGDNDCVKKYSKIKYENTMMSNHGYKYNWNNKSILNKSIINSQSEEAKKKHKETCLKLYGNENYVNHEKTKQTKLERYGDENYVNHEKTKQTKIERYGNENYVNIEKIKQTKLERYGDENYVNHEKTKQTKLERYGNENYVNIEKIKQTQFNKFGKYAWNTDKQLETCLKKYGVKNVFSSKFIQDKIKQSRYKHFGKYQSDLQILKSHSKEANRKRNITKKKNNSFNTSKPEDQSYLLLKEKYNDVKRQYKSEEYPYLCDFYIPSLDLYIECNYHWTHGKHAYDPTNIEDNLLLEKWKQKNTKFYNNAINTWTRRDVKKREIANKNKINYIEFWNIDELNKYIEAKYL